MMDGFPCLRVIITIYSSNPTPGHISREDSNSKGYVHPSVHSSSTFNSQDMEVIQVLINRQIDKEDVVCVCIYVCVCVSVCLCVCVYIYIYSRILFNHKKNETMPLIATWVDLEIIILNKVSQRKTNTYDKFHYTWNLKN